MKKKYFLAVFIISFLFNCKESFANIGPPGFFNVGTGRTLTPSFSKEIKSAEKVAMQNEVIKINLYKGFAIIKGEYNMLNSSDKPISINVGYPQNGVFINKEVSSVMYNELDNLQVYVDNKKTKIDILKSDIETDRGELDKWYIWKTTFLPKKLTKLIVYYMVDTHYAKMRFGYDSSSDNGLAYIIESGKLWHGKIGEGLISIKLMDELEENDLIGLLPEKKLLYNDVDKLLVYKFSNLEPTENDNIIIRYKDRTKNFSYDLIKSNFLKYYETIDKTPVTRSTNNLKELNKHDFKIFPYTMTFILSILFFIALIIITIIFFIIRFAIKNVKRNKI